MDAPLSNQQLHQVEVIALRHAAETEAQDAIKFEGAEGVRALIGCGDERAAAADRSQTDRVLQASAPDLTCAVGDGHLILRRCGAGRRGGASAADVQRGVRCSLLEAGMLGARVTAAFLVRNDEVATASVEDNHKRLGRGADGHGAEVGDLVRRFVRQGGGSHMALQRDRRPRGLAGRAGEGHQHGKSCCDAMAMCDHYRMDMDSGGDQTHLLPAGLSRT
mmetsp:Transcript_41663/g.107831  ORF Transcript_41663/g.107831 Transcript_41663/m.107831 type:complete len:220 (-) Transcript_41663:2-661(-)